ncbi:hypothetical protein [Streptomyces noursei]|uniref:hypothetical protein n=1 Tax=Streptomyces noursei TaxID=1971 RepID=UPI00380DEA2C
MRSGADGFLTPWGHSVCAREDHLAAQIAEARGTWKFPALFDLTGALVPARRTRSPYGWSWELLDEQRSRTGWFNESKASTPEARRQCHAAKGFYLSSVRGSRSQKS